MPLLYCQAVKAGVNIMRNKSLDAGKAMAAFGVVFIHVSFPGQTGQIIKALARSAVPFFFMVSGYFCYYNRRNTDRGKRITDKIPAKVQHILTLLAFAVLFYFLWESAMHLVEKEAIGPWLQEMVKKEHLKELFRYNSTSQLKPHLWFLPALIYCYILDYFIEKLHLGKLAYLSVPVLLGCFLWRAYFGRFQGVFYHTMEYRNYFFMGMPFFLTGQMIHEYEKLLDRKLSWQVLAVGGLLGSGGTIWEYFQAGAREVYPGNVLLAVCLFLLCILYDTKSRRLEYLAVFGREFAFPIYLLHPAAAELMKKLADFLGISRNPAYLWLRPILVCGCTIFLVRAVSRRWSSQQKCGIVFRRHN